MTEYSNQSIYKVWLKSPVEDSESWFTWANETSEKWVNLLQRMSAEASASNLGWPSNVYEYLIKNFYLMLIQYDREEKTNLVNDKEIWKQFFIDTFYIRYGDLKIGPPSK